MRKCTAVLACHIVWHAVLCYAMPVLCCAVQIGSQSTDKAVLWVICRQHPGEPMAEWFAEGLLERLTAEQADTEVQQLLGSSVLYVVPNMCLDGSVRWVCEMAGGGGGAAMGRGRWCWGEMAL